MEVLCYIVRRFHWYFIDMSIKFNGKNIELLPLMILSTLDVCLKVMDKTESNGGFKLHLST